MSWRALAGVITIFPSTPPAHDDDIFDRLNHKWTVRILVIFSGIVMAKQYVGSPITCWVPKHFTGAWEDYTNSYCWIRNTYFLRWEEDIPKSYKDREDREIVYYQWVSLFLLLQAFVFLCPNIFWKMMNHKTGISVHDIVDTAVKYQFTDDTEVKRKAMRLLTMLLDRSIARSRKRPGRGSICSSFKIFLSRICCCCFGKDFGNYITILYIVVKLLFLVNAVAQLFILNSFLGQDFTSYGHEVLDSVVKAKDWTEGGRFPRVTLCDLDIRRLGNVHRYTVQCVLTVNLFNEKIYLFIWFWVLFITAGTVVGLMIFIIKMLSISERYRTLKNNLAMSEHFDYRNGNHKILLHRFVDSYLHHDGFVVLHLLDINTNKMVLCDVLSELWLLYLDKPENKEFLKSTDEGTDYRDREEL